MQMECASDAQIEPLMERGWRVPQSARPVCARWPRTGVSIWPCWRMRWPCWPCGSSRSLLKQTRRTEGVVPTLALALTFTLFLMFALQARWLPVFGNCAPWRSICCRPRRETRRHSAANNAVSNPAALQSLVFWHPCWPRRPSSRRSLYGLIRRENSVAFLVRGIARWGGAMAGAFLLLYAVTLTTTVREETRARDALARTVQHEGRYLADIQHRPWPQ